MPWQQFVLTLGACTMDPRPVGEAGFLGIAEQRALRGSSMAIPRRHILLLTYIVLYYPSARLIEHFVSPMSNLSLTHSINIFAWNSRASTM